MKCVIQIHGEELETALRGVVAAWRIEHANYYGTGKGGRVPLPFDLQALIAGFGDRLQPTDGIGHLSLRKPDGSTLEIWVRSSGNWAAIVKHPNLIPFVIVSSRRHGIPEPLSSAFQGYKYDATRCVFYDPDSEFTVARIVSYESQRTDESPFAFGLGNPLPDEEDTIEAEERRRQERKFSPPPTTGCDEI